MDGIDAMGGGPLGYWRFFTLIGFIAMCMSILAFWGTRERVALSAARKTEKIAIREVLKLLKANKGFIVVTVFTAFAMLYPAFMGINPHYMEWIMKDKKLIGPYMSVLYLALLITLVGAAPIVPRIGKINAAFIPLS